MRASVGLERATRDAEEWSAALRAAHATVDRGAGRASALRSKRVLCQTDGSPFTRQIVQNRMNQVAKRANVRKGVHILRHTFCSHLSMRGAPARAIQELAGHADLTMTQRYMHLSPAALDAAIKLLDEPRRERGLPVSERQN